MCEMFGVSGKNPIQLNHYLKAFFEHSNVHLHGWGMANFDGEIPVIEKEAVPAFESKIIEEKLKKNIVATNMFAHIRLATQGSVAKENCHPFYQKDQSGRSWTLIHNGTMFNCPILDKYKEVQRGKTDSERILLYIIDEVNQRQAQKGDALTKEERFKLLDEIICRITKNNNKVNLLIYDGELFFVHTNYKDTLHYKKVNDTLIFSTVPLDEGKWEAVPFTTLLAYEKGILSFTGTNHGNEYIKQVSRK